MKLRILSKIDEMIKKFVVDDEKIDSKFVPPYSGFLVYELLKRFGRDVLRKMIKDFNYFIAKCIAEPTLRELWNKMEFFHKIYRNLSWKENYITDEDLKISVCYIPKVIQRNGKKRTLHIPVEPLKKLQRKILKLFYGLGIKFEHAFGFLPGRNCYQHVSLHKNFVLLLHVDIKDAFDSVRFSSLRDALNYFLSEDTVEKIMQYCYYKVLPQGAPTSGWLLNLLLNRVDNYIAEICFCMGFRYSRYADNIVISEEYEEGRKYDAEYRRLRIGALLYIKRRLSEKLNRIGMRLNRQKTKLIVNFKRTKVTHLCGYVVGREVTISHKKRKLYRAMLYNHFTDKRKLPDSVIAGIKGYLNTAGYKLKDILPASVED